MYTFLTDLFHKAINASMPSQEEFDEIVRVGLIKEERDYQEWLSQQ